MPLRREKGELFASNNSFWSPDFFRGVLEKSGGAAQLSRFLDQRRYKVSVHQLGPAFSKKKSSNFYFLTKMA